MKRIKKSCRKCGVYLPRKGELITTDDDWEKPILINA